MLGMDLALISVGFAPPGFLKTTIGTVTGLRQKTAAIADYSSGIRQTVGVAQEIAYLDFGFSEPGLLAAIAKTAKDGQAAPIGLDGTLVTRVAMGVDVLARLHQQIQHVLVGLRDARQP